MVLKNRVNSCTISMTGFGKVCIAKSSLYRFFFVFLKRESLPEGMSLLFSTRFLRISFIRGIKGPKGSFFNSKIIKFVFSIKVVSKQKIKNIYHFSLMLELISKNFFSVKGIVTKSQKIFIVECLILVVFLEVC